MADYVDSDFVYFDPKTRAVIGPVQWSKTGTVKPLERPEDPNEQKEDTRRRGRRREREYYIWGSYRSLKRLYNIEGKTKDVERTQTLDEALQRSSREAYWDTAAEGTVPDKPVA